MAIQMVKVGESVNDGTGDPSRTCFTKINQNFTDNNNAASRLVGTATGNVMEVGAFGLGKRPILRDATVFNEGFYTTANGSANGAPSSGATAGHIDVKTAANTLWGMMHWQNITDGRHWFKLRDSSGNIGAWQEYITTVNTQVDPNGFIKKASPIVSLYTDKIELNDEATQQDITFEKLGIGDYLIKGSTGFAQEGWYVEMPKDANGNALIAVVYEQLANNDISVKTYAKKFDEETGDIVANTAKPRDIPSTRWIDLRLQALPQPVSNLLAQTKR